MAKQIYVAIEISDSRLAKWILGQIQELPDVQTIQSLEPKSNNGSNAIVKTPDIVLLDENQGASDILSRLRNLRDGFPQAAIFLLTTNQNPKHIVEVMKAGVSEYLVPPIDPKSLHASIEEVRSRLVTSGKIGKAKVYSFISSKGGLGSTTIAVNTAAAMAMENGNAVALCDMSLQSGDATVLLDIVPQTTILEISRNLHRLDASFLRGAMINHPIGLDFLAAPMKPEDSATISGDHIEKIFELARTLYDHIIVDCTSMFINECTIEALLASDKIIVITDLSVPAVRNTARLCKHIEKSGISPRKIEIAVNRFIKGSALSLSETERSLNKRVFWLFPNDFDAIVSSINRGIPLVKERPGSSCAKNMKDFIKKLHDPDAEENYRGMRGAFRKPI